MEETFTINIVTPLKTYPNVKAEKLFIQTDSGEICILAHHAQYLANINISIMTIVNNNQAKHYAVGGGLVYFHEKENYASLILNKIKSVDEIDIEQTQKEQQELEDKLKASSSTFEHKQAETQLKCALNEIYAKNTFKN